ncbi:19K protein [Drosophila innubila nudivirus]|uniref:19K protein n=1 Tax=Drosophila innubila nudivirus TaxID=2057187 RepID=A0A2H4UX49_9VIRU|nr:19K protein [Drosophila innubila nudivirus]ATZ81492.1 19K protein [Drosophila innubila nudivirus]
MSEETKHNKYSIFQICFTIIIVIICLVCLVYMYIFKRTSNVDNVINQSVEKSQYHPTVFKIYDKSTVNKCNRVIIVEPFGWYLWAIRGELYILNPESGIHCSHGSTSAIQVFATQFVETCLTLDMNSIYLGYINGKTPKIVPYEINDTTFTILSAINILVKEYINFNLETSTSVSNINMYHDFTNNDSISNDNNDQDSMVNVTFQSNKKINRIPSDSHNMNTLKPNPKGRQLNSDELTKILKTSRSKFNIAKIHKAYTHHVGSHLSENATNYKESSAIQKMHLRKRRDTSEYPISTQQIVTRKNYVSDLNPTDLDFATKRQNAIDTFDIQPRLVEIQ